MNLNLENASLSTKSIIRKEFKTKRADLTKAEIGFYSDLVQKNFSKFFTDNPQIFSGKIIALYLENKGEVMVSKIADFLRNQHQKICYPRIVAKDAALEFVELKLDEENIKLKKLPNSLPFDSLLSNSNIFGQSKFFANILEPKSGNEVQPDILLIPLLAFDAYGTRLGMGGGFYDRTLANLRQKNHRLLAIGLAFKWQFCEELPYTKFDEPLNIVITDEGRVHF